MFPPRPSLTNPSSLRTQKSGRRMHVVDLPNSMLQTDDDRVDAKVLSARIGFQMGGLLACLDEALRPRINTIATHDSPSPGNLLVWSQETTDRLRLRRDSLCGFTHSLVVANAIGECPTP